MKADFTSQFLVKRVIYRFSCVITGAHMWLTEKFICTYKNPYTYIKNLVVQMTYTRVETRKYTHAHTHVYTYTHSRTEFALAEEESSVAALRTLRKQSA